MQVVDGVEHRAGIEDGHHAVAGMRAAALVAVAFDRGDAAVLAHADFELDVGFRPAAMGDEGFLAVGDDAHRAVALAGEQCRDQFDVEGLGAAAKPPLDIGDQLIALHLHAEDSAPASGGRNRALGLKRVPSCGRGGRRIRRRRRASPSGSGRLRRSYRVPRAPGRLRRSRSRRCRVRTIRRVRYCRACCRAVSRRLGPARPRRCNRLAIRAP